MSQVTVTGASSLIGYFLLPTLESLGAQVRAVSRTPPTDPLFISNADSTQWIQADITTDSLSFEQDEVLIHLAPIWTLGALLQNSERPPKRIIAFSSTSRFTKLDSSSASEREVAEKLALGENQLVELGREHSIGWTLFRPTLIYGAGLDQNVSKIARTIEKFRFFPLAGKGEGLRMPVHAADLANACIDALKHPKTKHQAYNLTGGEELTYKEMVERIFTALNKKTYVLPVPEGFLKALIKVVNRLPQYSDVKPEMIDRMNQDLVFDSEKARSDFGYNPRPFNPERNDVLPYGS